MKYRTVLFDFDGTIMNSGPGIISCVAETAKRFGMPIPDDSILRKFVGPPIRLSFERAFGVSPGQAERMVECYRQIHNDTNAYRAGHIYDGIEGLLKKLNAAGAVCAVASVKRETVVRDTLAHFNLLSCFRAICGGGGGPKLPDKAEIVLECLRRLNADTKNAILIGDSDYDAVGARETGVDFCAVLWGFGFDGMEDLKPFQCRYIARDAASLERFLL